MASGGKRGAGERVLEGRHVIGLFMLMLLFSGVFFTLGYVMGRNQYDGQVGAVSRPLDDILGKPTMPAKRPAEKTPPAAPPKDMPAHNSDWEFYNAGKPKTTEDHLKPAESAPSRKAVPAVVKNGAPPKPVDASSKTAAPSKSLNASPIPGGAYTLQVAALSREADALDLASRLQNKKFPVFVLSPQGDRFYRVQVGPYADQKSADAAKKGLEAAGFRAFVKH
jgi:septal ring-binding cell division protein DamX